MRRKISNRMITFTFCFLVILSFFAWLGLIVLQGKGSSQIDLFFLRMHDFLADFSNVVGYSSLRDPYNCLIYTGLAEKAYPPLCYLLMYCISRTVDIGTYIEINSFLSMNEDPLFLMIYFIYLIVCLIAIYELIKELKTGDKAVRVLFAITILVSQPLLYSIERGNLILLTLPLVLFFISFYNSDNSLLREMALFALAFASSLKLTPAFFGILLLTEKRWIDSIKTAVYGLILGIMPFLFFKGGFTNIQYFIRNIGFQMDAYAFSEGCTIKSFMFDYLKMERTPSCNMIANILTYSLCIILVLNILKTDKKWLKILCVSMVVVILPGHSEYYNVLFLVPAIILFFNKEGLSPIDFIVVISAFILLYDFQSALSESLNYHTSIFLMIIYVLFYDARELVLKKSSICF